MASLQRRSTGLYVLNFRFQGKTFCRSLDTHQVTEAERLKSTIEERLKHLVGGILKLPTGASADDLWSLLRHGGMVVDLPKLVKKISLEEVAGTYLASYPKGTKEIESLDTERSHLNNLKRVLGARTEVHTITAADLCGYINQRFEEDGNRGGKVKSDTIRKDLQTFRLLWFFAKREGYVSGDCPLGQIGLPKKRQRPPFQTWEQIESKIARGGLTVEQVAELWDCLFLRATEVVSFLEHAKEVSKQYPRFPFIYPALCFCWYTGARRSEMFRSEIDDVGDGLVRLREKKRNKEYEYTYRQVPIVPELNVILDEALKSHPGGQFRFCKNGCQPLDDRTSREAFEAVTKGSKWSVLRGYHVLRHSFVSNLAMKGVDERIIRKLAGHESEAMTRRYQHLFPEKEIDAIRVLSSCA